VFSKIIAVSSGYGFGGCAPGVLLVPQSLDVATALEELLLIWVASEASEWADSLVWLPL
jgi:hypothetical protein